MEINKPDDLADIAHLGLSLAEAKLLLVGVQREIVAAQARAHALRRPDCRYGRGVCRVKDGTVQSLGRSGRHRKLLRWFVPRIE